jgi:hypothetical protein
LTEEEIIVVCYVARELLDKLVRMMSWGKVTLGPNPKNSRTLSNKMDMDILPFGSGSFGLGPNPKNSRTLSNKMDMDILPFGSGSFGLGG